MILGIIICPEIPVLGLICINFISFTFIWACLSGICLIRAYLEIHSMGAATIKSCLIQCGCMCIVHCGCKQWSTCNCHNCFLVDRVGSK